MRAVVEQERVEVSELRKFWEKIYLRKLERDGASDSHIERHRAAVEWAERFAKRPLSPSEIDDQFRLNFDAWLWRQRTSDGRRRDLVESLIRVASAWTPSPRNFGNRRRRRALPEASPESLRGVWEQNYVPHQLMGRSPRTIDDGETVMYQLHEHFARDVLIDELSDELVAGHAGWLAERGLKPRSINRHLAMIACTWRYANRIGRCETLPGYRKLAVDNDAPNAWSSADMAKILEHCEAASTKPIAGIPAAAFWRALILTTWYTALRRRALLGLTWSDVDLRNRWLNVPGALMKGRRGKSFRLGPDAIAALRAIAEPKRKHIFGQCVYVTTLHVQLRRILDAAGVARDQPGLQGFHKIRRTVATALAAKDGIGAAQTALGHSSIRMTEKYCDPTKLPGTDFSRSLPELRTKSDQAGKA
jgi:integrase